MDCVDHCRRAPHTAGRRPSRVASVRHLEVDGTSFVRSNRHHSTVHATGLVDLEAKIVIDMVEVTASLTCGDGPHRSRMDGGPAWRHTDLAESSGPACPHTSATPPASPAPLPRGQGREPLRRQAAGESRRPLAIGAAKPTPRTDPQHAPHRPRAPRPVRPRSSRASGCVSGIHTTSSSAPDPARRNCVTPTSPTDPSIPK